MTKLTDRFNSEETQEPVGLSARDLASIFARHADGLAKSTPAPVSEPSTPRP